MLNTIVPSLIDSHCHLDDQRFDSDRDHVLERALAAGVSDIIVPSIAASNWDTVSRLCANKANCHALYGLHPMFLSQHKDSDLDRLSAWLQPSNNVVDTEASPPVGLGECGLDFSIEDLDQTRQLELFEGQLHLAKTHDLPIVIHARKAVEAVILAIRASGHTKGMVHSFNGSSEQAKRLIDLGFTFSFGGAITRSRAIRLRELIKSLPLDAFMLETDGPYQPDASHPGRRMEPAWLTAVFQAICDIREEPPDVVAMNTTATVNRVFELPSNN